MTDWVIETQQLTRKFGDYTAVDHLDLQVKKGQIFGFLGPNGCGKSTSIRLLTGLLTPTSGHVNVLGLNIPQQAEMLRSKVGYMTQKFSLYDTLSVQENLDFVGQVYGLPGAQRRERVKTLLMQYHLADKQKVRASELSGGQKQRLALAAATIHEPSLLFLDEPTSAVDPENRREFWEGLFDLSDQGTTILVSTHYMDEAERCHQLAILELGKKRIDGAPQTLMANLDGRVIELRGEQLRKVKSELLKRHEVLSVAQVGQTLRVLLRQSIENAGLWLGSDYASLSAERVRPSLEDVFVAHTGKAYAESQ